MKNQAISFGGARIYQYMGFLTGRDHAPLSGDCTDPIDLELRGRESPVLNWLKQWSSDDKLDYADGHGIIGYRRPERSTYVVLRVRCRKCPECRKWRGRLWTARAIDEYRSSERSWFGTLTLGPDEAFRYRLLAERRICRRASTPYSELTNDERTRAIANEAAPELTKWLKRIRKNSGASLRYLLICEPHKSGIPHWHCLIHEHVGQVRKRHLEAAWRAGISHFRLVEDAKAAGYVCKYLNKGCLTRVRASARYGSAGPRLYAERLKLAAKEASRNDEPPNPSPCRRGENILTTKSQFSD